MRPEDFKPGLLFYEEEYEICVVYSVDTRNAYYKAYHVYILTDFGALNLTGLVDLDAMKVYTDIFVDC